MASGRDPEAIRLNCVRIALNLQLIHNPRDCKEPEKPVSEIAGHREDAEDPQGQGSNLTPPIAIRGNYRSGHNPGPIRAQPV